MTSRGQIGLLSSLVAVLSVTELYRLTALVGIGFRETSTAIFLLSTIVAILGSILKPSLLWRKDFLYLAALFVVWPIVSSLLTTGVSTETIVRLIQLVLIFFLVSVGAEFLGIENFRKFQKSALWIFFLGAVVSFFAPALFLPMALSIGAFIDFDERAFGLSLQPNMLAVSVCFLYLCGPLSSDPDRRGRGELVAFFLTAGTALLSGSRYGIIAMAISACVRYLLIIRFERGTGRIIERFTVRGVKLIGILVCLVLLLPPSSSALRAILQPDLGSGLDRTLSLTSFSLTHGLDQERLNSVVLRIDAQESYWELIMQRPLLGHGANAEKEMFRTALLEVPAHSSAMSLALRFGVIFLIPLIFVLFRPILSWRRVRPDLKLHLWAFAVLSLASIILNHGLVENPIFYFCFATITAAARDSLRSAVAPGRSPLREGTPA